MDKVKGVNLARIVWCCEEQGLTVDDLFAQTKISPKTLDALRDGADALSPGQLEKISRTLHRGMLFFLEHGDADARKVHTPQFRTLTNQKTTLSAQMRALIERVQEQRAVFLALQDDIGESTAPSWEADTAVIRDSATASQQAAAIRKWLNLKSKNSFKSYRQSVEDKGILVFVSNGYQGPWQIDKASNIRGFSLYHAKYPVIFIKKQYSETAQSFTLMHELGHLLLHKDSFIDEQEDFYSYAGKEKEANAFAGHLLVPKALLRQISLEKLGSLAPKDFDNALRDFSTEWGVSIEVILRRALDEGYIPKSSYEAYREWKNSLQPIAASLGGSRFRYREPLRVFGRPFVHTVLDALSSQKITLSRASSYLDNLKISDLRKLEEQHAHI